MLAYCLLVNLIALVAVSNSMQAVTLFQQQNPPVPNIHQFNVHQIVVCVPDKTLC